MTVTPLKTRRLSDLKLPVKDQLLTSYQRDRRSRQLKAVFNESLIIMRSPKWFSFHLDAFPSKLEVTPSLGPSTEGELGFIQVLFQNSFPDQVNCLTVPMTLRQQ